MVFTAGDLELTGSEQVFDEFSGGATSSSPTYVVGQSGLNHLRSHIGYSYSDLGGGAKAQYLQLTNLTVGGNYTVGVYTSGNSSLDQSKLPLRRLCGEFMYVHYRDRKPHA